MVARLHMFASRDRDSFKAASGRTNVPVGRLVENSELHEREVRRKSFVGCFFSSLVPALLNDEPSHCLAWESGAAPLRLSYAGAQQVTCAHEHHSKRKNGLLQSQCVRAYVNATTQFA